MLRRILAGTSALLLTVSATQAQTAYTFDNTGAFASFDVTNPATITPLGNIGFVPEGIDFSPHNGLLYAIDVVPQIDVTPGFVQLYTLSLTTGAPSAVGSSFPLSGTVVTSYDLTGSTNFGFDVNPKTLQGDGSIRIRFVSAEGDNLRLNSTTGQIAGVDLALNPGTPQVTAVGYINNVAQATGPGVTTTLFDIDSGSDTLSRQAPPNDGTLVTVGSLSENAGLVSGFDIFTAADGTTNTAYLVTDSDPVVLGSELYTVDLTSGAATPVGVAGLIGTGFFAQDIAVQPIPEPATAGLLLGGLAGLLGFARRRA